MTEVERYKKLRLELEDIGSRIIALRTKINAPRADAGREYDELMRAEFLGDPSAADKRGAIIQTSAGELRKIKAECEDLEHRRGILHSALEEVRKKAEPELGAVHTRHFARAVKAFASALRAAYKAELELAATREQADRAFIDEIESRLVPLPAWEPLLLRGCQSSSPMRGELVKFLEMIKGQGFDIE